MWAPTYRYSYLCHHGILGMKWGKKNGPPYPLDAEDHSQSEKKAGWRKSLSDEQKANINKAAKITAGVILGAAVVGGTIYLAKTGKLDDVIKSGKNICNKFKDKPVDDLVGDAPKLSETIGKFNKLDSKSTPKSVTDAFGNLTNNPLKKTDNVEKNCTNVFLAFAARMKGIDAKPGFQKDAAGNFVENKFEDVLKCFNLSEDSTSVNIYSNAKRFMGTDNAVKELLRKYPENGSYGYLDARFNIRGKEFRHAISWMNENGDISFGDGINGLKAKIYFNFIMPNNEVRFFRADNLDINIDEISKYLKH